MTFVSLILSLYSFDPSYIRDMILIVKVDVCFTCKLTFVKSNYFDLSMNGCLHRQKKEEEKSISKLKDELRCEKSQG